MCTPVPKSTLSRKTASFSEGKYKWAILLIPRKLSLQPDTPLATRAALNLASVVLLPAFAPNVLHYPPVSRFHVFEPAIGQLFSQLSFHPRCNRLGRSPPTGPSSSTIASCTRLAASGTADRIATSLAQLLVTSFSDKNPNAAILQYGIVQLRNPRLMSAACRIFFRKLLRRILHISVSYSTWARAMNVGDLFFRVDAD